MTRFGLLIPQLLRHSTDAMVSGDLAQARRGAIDLLLIAIAGAVTRILSRLFIFNSGRKVEYDIRTDLFAVMLRLAPSFYGKMPSGQVMSRAFSSRAFALLTRGVRRPSGPSSSPDELFSMSS